VCSDVELADALATEVFVLSANERLALVDQ
jgi:hypothetical protein